MISPAAQSNRAPRSKRPSKHKRLLAVHILGAMALLQSFDALATTVTNSGDAGAGSYRQAVTDVNAGINTPSTITFSAAQAITALSAMPTITNAVLSTVTSPAPSSVTGAFDLLHLAPSSGTMDVIFTDVTYGAGSGSATLSNASAAFVSGGLNVGTITLDSGQLSFPSTVTIGATGFVTSLASGGSDPSFTLNNASATKTVAGTWSLGTATWFQAASASRLQLSGVISGAGSLKVSDAGTVALNSINTYSGGTTLLTGTLELMTNATIGSGTLTMNGATTLKASGTTSLSNAVQLIDDYSGIVYMDVDATKTLTLSGSISDSSGAAPISKIGDGTLVLSGSSSWAGGIQIEAGEVVADTSNTALGTGIAFLSNNGVTLSFNGTPTLANTIQFESGGTTPLLSAGAGDVATLTGPFVGASFEKVGAGTVVTQNANGSYTSDLTVSGGSLQVSGASATLGTGIITLDVGGSIGSRGADDVTIANHIVLNGTDTTTPSFFMDTGDLDLTGIVSGTGALYVQGSVGDELLAIPIGTVNTFSGVIKIDNGALLADGDGLGPTSNNVILTNDGAYWYGAACALQDRTLTIAAADTGALDPNGFNAAMPATSGTGTLTLSSASGNPGYLTGWTASSFPTIIDPSGLYVDATGVSVTMTTDQVCTTDSTNPTFTQSIPISSVDDTTTFSVRRCGTGAYEVLSTAQIGTGYIEVIEATLNLSTPSIPVGGAAPNGATLYDSTLTLSNSLDLSPTPIISVVTSGTNTVQHTGAGLTSSLGSLSGDALTISTGTFNLTANNSAYSSGVTVGTTLVFTDVNGAGVGTITTTDPSIFEFPTSGTFVNDVVLGGPLTETVASGISLISTGNLSGAQVLTSDGPGTLSLRGNNSHAGNVVTAGTFNIASDSNLGSTSADLTIGGATLQFGGSAQMNSQRSVTLTGATVIDAQGYAPSIGGPISGSAPITKSGGGTLTLDGTSTGYTGTLTIAGGTLSVNGALDGPGSQVVVNSGATVKGSGAILQLQVNGTINSSGTNALAIGDTLTMGLTGTMGTVITPRASSNFTAGESATVAGTLNTNISFQGGGAFIVGARYPIVTSPIVAGRFNTVNLTGNVGTGATLTTVSRSQGECCSSSACCGSDCCFDNNGIGTATRIATAEFELVYTGTQIYYEVLKGAFPGGRPLCCPAAGVYDYLVNFNPNGDADLEAVYGDLASLRDCDFDCALVQLSPVNWDGMEQSAQELTILNQTLMSERVGLVAHTPCADQDPGVKGWAGVVGGVAARHGSNGYSGWSAGLFDLGIGTDYSNDSWRLGAAFSYGTDHMNWTENASSGNYRSYGGSLYGSWTGDEFYVYGSAFGAGTTLDGHREICFPGVQRVACSDHSGATLALRLGAGYTAKWDKVSVIPYIDGDISTIHEGEWVEGGAESLNMRVFGRTVSYGRGSLGIAVAGCRGDSDSGLEAMLGLAFTYQGLIHNPCIISQLDACECDVDCMALSGNAISQQWASPMLMLKWHMGGCWDFILQGNANIGSSIKTASGLAQLAYRF
ncbi:MAG: autotransporter domain-containing protein [Chlamydiia bacterium]